MDAGHIPGKLACIRCRGSGAGGSKKTVTWADRGGDAMEFTVEARAHRAGRHARTISIGPANGSRGR